jgi:hypothetical protein
MHMTFNLPLRLLKRCGHSRVTLPSFCLGWGSLAPACSLFPVLAGSAAYGVAEAFDWTATLEAKPSDAIGFYAITAAATVGLCSELYSVRPHPAADLECRA